MNIPYYHVDAFASEPFHGNPAGVCLLEKWEPAAVMQNIAAENNLSETAFLKPQEDYYELRWFTPKVEVDLCGHATLASAFVLFSERGHPGDRVRFHSQSGWLAATRRRDVIELDFPARPPLPCLPPESLIDGLGKLPRETLKSRDYLAVFDSMDEVAALSPNMDILAQLDCLGVIVTAGGRDCDFVSRFFAPAQGVPEDPVTGSSHCSLIPFWAGRLGKTKLLARQISSRGGELHCRLLGDRVGIGGGAVIYSRSELVISDD
jgi:predicted PhzF superfamily epimerase YddE/YHI9